MTSQGTKVLKIREVSAKEVPRELLRLADPSDAMIDAYLTQGQSFVAEASGCAIGEVVLVPTRPQTLEIMNLAVDINYQRRGVGRVLIRHVIAYPRSRPVRALEVGTGNSSLGPLLLYQQCGFRIVGIDRDFFIRHYPEPIWEHGIWCRDMLRLSLDLTSAPIPV